MLRSSRVQPPTGGFGVSEPKEILLRMAQEVRRRVAHTPTRARYRAAP